jgi:hypothetical protein
MKEEKTEAGKKSTLNITAYCKKFRSARHPHYSAMPFMPMPYSISPGMTNYHPWSYFEPWMHHNSFDHQRVFRNRYSFG